jgi:antitoxin component YwqK of YwqJK toxin-antitoxin module
LQKRDPKPLRAILKKSYLWDAKISSMKNISVYLLILCLALLTPSCGSNSKENASSQTEEQSNMVKKRREDGTLSSMNPVDEEGYVHGVKVNFYEDGLTVHSKVTFEHGRKHGPAIWFFKNGKIYEHTTYFQNRKHGLTKRYYETGELKEEAEFNTGEELAGKKEYTKDGKLKGS